jgi:phage tail protein X
LIEKGAFRLSLQMFEEGRFAPIGTINLGCAEAYFGTANILERILRLTPGLAANDVAELEACLRVQRPAPAEADTAESESAAGPANAEDSAASAQPGLAKTSPGEASEERPRAGRRST